MNELYKLFCQFWDKYSTEHNETMASLVAVGRTGEVPQTLARRNERRTEIWITNAGDRDLFIAPVNEGVGENLFSLALGPQDTVVINAANYAQMHKQEIYGFWDSAVAVGAAAMVTEFSLQK